MSAVFCLYEEELSKPISDSQSLHTHGPHPYLKHVPHTSFLLLLEIDFSLLSPHLIHFSFKHLNSLTHSFHMFYIHIYLYEYLHDHILPVNPFNFSKNHFTYTPCSQRVTYAPPEADCSVLTTYEGKDESGE